MQAGKRRLCPLLVKEITVLLHSPPSTPPSHSLLHNTQRLRLTRTYQVISGQADLSLSSSLGLFSFENTFLHSSLHSLCLFLSCLLSSSPFIFFVRLSSVHAWELLGGVMCAESDPRDRQPSRIRTSISGGLTASLLPKR